MEAFETLWRRGSRLLGARYLKCKELKNLSTTTFPTPVLNFLEEAEERGVIDESALEALALEHDLDEEEVTALRAELDSREVDVFVPEAQDAHVAPASTDSLTCS